MIQIKRIFKMYPKSIWILTLIEFIFISRKTIFNVSREVGDYSATIDSSTSLAILGIACSLICIVQYSKLVKYIHKIMATLIMVYIVAALSFLWAGNMFSILFKATEVLANIYIIGIILILLFQSCNIKQTIYYNLLFNSYLFRSIGRNGEKGNQISSHKCIFLFSNDCTFIMYRLSSI